MREITSWQERGRKRSVSAKEGGGSTGRPNRKGECLSMYVYVYVQRLTCIRYFTQLSHVIISTSCGRSSRAVNISTARGLRGLRDI